jgi:hypothetical protein
MGTVAYSLMRSGLPSLRYLGLLPLFFRWPFGTGLLFLASLSRPRRNFVKAAERHAGKRTQKVCSESDDSPSSDSSELTQQLPISETNFVCSFSLGLLTRELRRLSRS